MAKRGYNKELEGLRGIMDEHELHLAREKSIIALSFMWYCQLMEGNHPVVIQQPSVRLPTTRSGFLSLVCAAQ